MAYVLYPFVLSTYKFELVQSTSGLIWIVGRFNSAFTRLTFPLLQEELLSLGPNSFVKSVNVKGASKNIS